MFKKICYCLCILKLQTTNDCSSIFERLDTRSNTKLSVAIQTKQMAQKLENATSSMVLRAQVIFRNPRKDATTCIRMKISETFFCCANHILFSDGKFWKFEKKQLKIFFGSLRCTENCCWKSLFVCGNLWWTCFIKTQWEQKMGATSIEWKADGKVKSRLS